MKNLLLWKGLTEWYFLPCYLNFCADSTFRTLVYFWILKFRYISLLKHYRNPRIFSTPHNENKITFHCYYINYWRCESNSMTYIYLNFPSKSSGRLTECWNFEAHLKFILRSILFNIPNTLFWKNILN